MKRTISIILLFGLFLSLSCSKVPDDDYHDYWWKSRDYVAGNYKVFFHFSDNNRLEFKCSDYKYATKFFPSSNTSRTYTDNGNTIDLHDFTVSGGRSFGAPMDDEIVFHNATWKKGKPNNTSETITAALEVSYTYTSYKLTGEIDQVENKSCTLSIISGEPDI